jgi:hypothetical protein
MKTEVIGLCCSNQNGVSLEEIREALKESDAQLGYNNAPRITIDPWGGNVNLGEIEGLDNTKSELDVLSKNVRQFDFMISTPSFDFLKNRSDQIQQCLLIQACILNNPTLPSEIDMKDFRLALQVCLDHLYACAFVDSDSFPKQLLWELDSSNPIQITHRCKFSEDGKVLVETRTLYSAAAARAYSITIKYEDAVNGVRVRGIGWRTMEQLHNREFGYWDNVPEGKDGYNWKAGEYEVEIELKNGTKKKIADAFKPIPDPSIEEERTWIFLPSKWKSN